MDEETADKLADGERHHHGPVTPAGEVVVPLEDPAFDW
jgi:hypothetical protein